MIKNSIELLDQESANSWEHLNCSPTDWDSECGWELVHGGSGRFGAGCKISKTYYSLDIPHYKAGVRFDLYIIDSWDFKGKFVSVNSSGEALIVKIDEKIVFSDSMPKQTRSLDFGNFCGRGYNDFFQVYYNILDHELNEIKVEISADIDENGCNESWGISNFQLFFYICHSSCLTCSGPLSTNCKTCYNGASKNYNDECKCDGDNYMLFTECKKYQCSNCVSSCPDRHYGNVTTKWCTLCDQSCWTCNGELSNQCLKCINGFFLTAARTVKK